MSSSEFASLHTHDEYSLLDGAMKNRSMVELAQQQGLKAIAQTNHGNVDGALKHVKACKEFGIQPILGCEAYMLLPGEQELLPKKRIKRHHLTILSKDLTGFRLMMKALTRGWTTASPLNKFSGIPIQTPLEEGWKDHVVILTGCASSPFWKEKGMDWLPKYHDVFGKDLYAETMAIDDFPGQAPINQMALASGLPTVVTTDAHYCKPSDHESHEVLLAIGTKARWTDPNRFRFDSKMNYMRPPSELLSSLVKAGWKEDKVKRSLLNTLEVAEKCAWKLEAIPINLPPVLPEGEDEILWLTGETYRVLCERGFGNDPVYEERLERELTILIKAGIVRYILLVMDLVRWAKRSGISCGPARGSVAGSLVCWLLGITEVNPIQYKLIFERFYSAGRIDLPDIDMDFEDRKRWMIEQYLREKYGEHNVAKVSTHALLKGKLAINDVSRVFDVPRQEAKKMCDTIIMRGDQDARSSFSIADACDQFDDAKAFRAKYPVVFKHACALEGLAKQVGVHAAGLVVSAKDLRDGSHCVVASREGDRVCNWDKKDLEHMGLMKLDVLGLNTLTVLEDTKVAIKDRHGVDVDWLKVDLEDRATYEKTITPGFTATCFQIGSRGLQKFCQQLGVKNFKTLVDASALWRPGTLRSGITGAYTECHQGTRQPEYLNEYHRELSKDTYGQIVYQEQVMYLLHRVAGMSWSHTDLVRKSISKREGTAEFMKGKKMFVEGCIKNKTLTEKQATELFDKLQFFGMYSFNLSHSVSYGMISFWTAWAKTHYPVEFECATLNYGSVHGKEGMSQATKLDEALREVKRLGIKVDRPDINLSGARWTIGPKNQLVAALAEIKGVSKETGELLLEARAKAGGKFNTITDLVATVNRRRVNKGVVQKLLLAGALDSILGDKLNYWRLWFEDLYEYVLAPKKLELAYEALAPRVEEQWARRQAPLLDMRSSLLRFTEIGGREFAQFRAFLKDKIKIVDLADIKKYNGNVWCFGVITSLKYGWREGFKFGDQANQTDTVGTSGMMGGAYGNLDDGTGYLMAVFLSEFYSKNKAVVEGSVGKRLLIRGKYNQKRHNMYIQDVWSLEELSAAKFRGLSIPALRGSKDGWHGEHRKRVLACTQCDLRKGCTQPVPGSPGKLRAMVVGEAPGYQEDKDGRSFVGGPGKVLWGELGQLGLTRPMLHTYTAIGCRPKDNVFPGLPYVGRCPWLAEGIKLSKPVAILALGNKAMFYFNGQSSGISELCGKTEWVSKANAWVTYCINPSAVLHDEANRPALQKGLKEFVRVLSEIS